MVGYFIRPPCFTTTRRKHGNDTEQNKIESCLALAGWKVATPITDLYSSWHKCGINETNIVNRFFSESLLAKNMQLTQRKKMVNRDYLVHDQRSLSNYLIAVYFLLGNIKYFIMLINRMYSYKPDLTIYGGYIFFSRCYKCRSIKPLSHCEKRIKCLQSDRQWKIFQELFCIISLMDKITVSYRLFPRN